MSSMKTMWTLGLSLCLGLALLACDSGPNADSGLDPAQTLDDSALLQDPTEVLQEKTTCETNCSSACEVGYNYPCPTWRNPGRTCRGHTLDPACKARCEIEREIECRTGLNGCSLWSANPAWVGIRDGLRSYASQGLTAGKCADIVKLGGTAAGVAGAAYTAYVEGIMAALEVNPVGLVIAKGVEHGAICACRSALD